MCVIIYKEAGHKFPTPDELHNCHVSNPHGAGFAFAKDGKMHIRKGFKDDTELCIGLIKCEMEHGNMEQYPMLLHFRYATHGEKGPKQTHPFPISDKVEDLDALEITSDIALAHNGIIHYTKRDDVLSDTQVFIKDYIGNFTWEDINKSKYLLSRAFSGDKVVIMNGDGSIYYWGNFIEHNECFFSNRSWEKSVIVRESSTTLPLMVWDTKQQKMVRRNEVVKKSLDTTSGVSAKNKELQKTEAERKKERKKLLKKAREAYKTYKREWGDKFIPWQYITEIIDAQGISLHTTVMKCEGCGNSVDIYMFRKSTVGDICLCPMCAAGWDSEIKGIDIADLNILDVDDATVPVVETQEAEEVYEGECVCCNTWSNELKIRDGQELCEDCEKIFAVAGTQHQHTLGLY